MPQTYKIYGLIDPRDSEFYYVGQTRRKLTDRFDEHLVDPGETLVSKRNQAIQRCSIAPGIVTLDKGIKDERTAFYRELYRIFEKVSEGHHLLNREAQNWFYERYDELVDRRRLRKAPKQTTAKKQPGIVTKLIQAGLSEKDAREMWEQQFDYVVADKRPGDNVTFTAYIEEKIALLKQKKHAGTVRSPAGFLRKAVKENWER